MTEKFVKKPMTSPKERIVLAAWDLFHEQGLDGTSVDEILKKSETGKSQFYHYFGSKEGLVHAMLEEARKLIKDGHIEGIATIENWDDLKGWFDHTLEKIMHHECSRACPLGRFAAELSSEDEAIRKDILLVFEAKKQYLKEFFIKEKALGHLKEDADPDGLADFCDAVIQGGCLLAKMHKDKNVAKETFDHAYAYLLSLKK